MADMRDRTCGSCGMVLRDAGEFHPHVFCVLKKAGRDPWADFRFLASQFGHDLPPHPPLVRDMKLFRVGGGRG